MLSPLSISALYLVHPLRGTETTLHNTKSPWNPLQGLLSCTQKKRGLTPPLTFLVTSHHSLLTILHPPSPEALLNLVAT